MLTLDLTKRLCVVTGATGELGRTMCRTLARAGADIAVHYHSAAEYADSLVNELRETGVRAEPFGADVTVPEDVQSLRDRVADKLGKPDIIVNNAVIQYKWTSVLEQDAADYESQFRSSVLQNVLMTQAFVPAMIERKWGRVIGINTECAMQNTETESAYVSGKRGMDGVLRVLAREVGPHGITVNQVAPGWTISENRPDTDSPSTQQYREKIPLRRRGTDQETANVVAFLASDLASYVTGVYLPVCGGNVMPAI